MQLDSLPVVPLVLHASFLPNDVMGSFILLASILRDFLSHNFDCFLYLLGNLWRSNDQLFPLQLR